MIFKKLFFTFLATLFIHNLSRADIVASCGSALSCNDLSRETGFALLAMAAVVGPHFIGGNTFNGKQTNKNNKVLYSFGGRDFKSLYFELNGLRANEIILSTNFDVQLYDRATPSVFMYGIGAGYNLSLNEYLWLVPVVKLAVQKIESVDGLKSAPELDMTLANSLEEKTNIELGTKAIFLEKTTWKIYTGISHGFRKGNSSGMGDMAATVAIGYEENPSLRTKTNFLSLGLIF